MMPPCRRKIFQFQQVRAVRIKVKFNEKMVSDRLIDRRLVSLTGVRVENIGDPVAVRQGELYPPGMGTAAAKKK